MQKESLLLGFQTCIVWLLGKEQHILAVGSKPMIATVNDDSNISLLSVYYNHILSRPLHCSFGKVESIGMSPMLALFPCEMYFFFRSNIVLDSNRVRHSISPQQVMLPATLWRGKSNPFPQYLSSSVKINCCPSIMEGFQCNQPETDGRLLHPRE